MVREAGLGKAGGSSAEVDTVGGSCGREGLNGGGRVCCSLLARLSKAALPSQAEVGPGPSSQCVGWVGGHYMDKNGA